MQPAVVKNVFLIDDDSVFNLISENAIETIGRMTGIRSFDKPTVALDRLKQLADSSPESFPDVIFLDIYMPVIDGWEFLDEFQEFPPDVIARCRLYLVTASIDQNDAIKSKSYQCVKDVLIKPLKIALIHRILNEIVGD